MVQHRKHVKYLVYVISYWLYPPLGHPFLRQTWPNRPFKA